MEEMDTENANQDLCSDSSSDGNEDEEEKLIEARAAELEQQVSANPYLYDNHVELTELYRKLGDLTSMRAAYERFSTAYPLTATIWLQWIQDEIKISQTDKEKRRILDLFKKAIRDYHSGHLWQEYCQYAIGNCSIEETREIFEMGVSVIGIHVSEGSLIWDMYREFEMAHLSVTKPESEEFTEQLNRVINLYHRQLRVPLLDMENTMKEYQQFIEQLPDDHGVDVKQIEWAYNNALKLVEKYKKFENDLLTCDDDNEAFNIYTNYIKAIDDRILIICTYERAVARLPLNIDLWIAYCQFAPQLGRVALTVTEKAVRNCSWVSDLWGWRLKVMEIHKEKPEEVLLCFEESLKCVGNQDHLKLWRYYIEYVRRQENMDMKLKTIFSQAREQLAFDPEQYTKLLRMEADLIVKTDYEEARKIWSEIMSIKENKNSGILWVSFLSLEKHFGTSQNLRSLYQKAMKNCPEWAEYFSDEWIMHEQETNTVENVMKCMVNSKKMLTEIQAKNNNHDNDFKNSKRNFYETQNSRTIESELRVNKKLKQNQKEVIEKPCIKVVQIPTDLDPSTTVFISNITPSVSENVINNLFPNSLKITIPTDKFGQSRCFAYVQFKDQEETNEALKRDREPINGRPMFISKYNKDNKDRQIAFKYETKREPKKLFVRGLPLMYDQVAVGNIFKEFNPVEVRLVTKFNGKSKGLAYVEFPTEDIAKKALLATDNKEIEGFTISVAISSPPPSKGKTVPMKSVTAPSQHPKSRLQFLPRCLEKNKSLPVEGNTVVKSNDDFRKLFNQKND
ncbi:squamous cell carcinoma antigen recognized by T-cells 3 [Onthophagus taurus]|uniref:squamous cell carcinoma antigen recognized by T-cells 3 n=1 Tax=Onthophagus taurus TaxID=166361 RepID=UPI000C20CA30|nr:squamous cell carcinoma antigen recognized by T-cells 3 [Onthophagus taurus]